MDIEQAHSKIKELTDPRIQEVGDLFLYFEMELIACGDETKITKRRQTIGHIDLLFKDTNIKKLFFVEGGQTGQQDKTIHLFIFMFILIIPLVFGMIQSTRIILHLQFS